MNQEKIFIKNRKGMRIVVLLERLEDQKGVVFIVHGHTGFKEQVQIQTFAEAFTEEGYTAVRIDTTNSCNESEGRNEDGTITRYYEDLEDVINWGGKQEWYQEPFCLAGHSMGSMVTALYGEKYPEKVKALAPISTIISGKFSREVLEASGELEEWEKTGWKERKLKTLNKIVRIPWSYLLDKDKYDLLIGVEKLTMPVLMIVGSEDKDTTPEHQKILFDKLPGKKEFHIIKGASHTFREKEHLEEIKEILKNWIRKQ